MMSKGTRLLDSSDVRGDSEVVPDGVLAKCEFLLAAVLMGQFESSFPDRRVRVNCGRRYPE